MISEARTADEWEDRMRELDRAGASLAQIATAFGVTIRTASRWRLELNLQHEPAHIPRPASDRERAAELLDEGCSFEEAARTLGVTGPTIRRWFPDRSAWTREEVGTFSVQARQLNNLTTNITMRNRAGRKAS